ncbi:methionine--tRNA ligase, mitochondrial [Trichomonascus vanleenenianus]|uniref:methionine--tRNA ligase MSM1 n=1 Tax=Trichomonascus vanleenenianus TaxID=2268995 RepID=UPI003ECB990D
MLAARQCVCRRAAGSLRYLLGIRQASSFVPSTEQLEEKKKTLESKPFYTTTPIFYVNAAPHVGHLHSMVLADVLKRWHSFADGTRPGYMTTGTDEHGLKVLQAAQKAGIPPQEYVDLAAGAFKALADQSKVSYDRFIRTTEQENKVASQALWEILNEKGYIYKGTHSGWYCISDETFYPENQVTEKQLANGDKVMVSKETDKPVEWIDEENYFFAMSQLKKELLEFYAQNPTFIQPVSHLKNLQREIELQGLSDLSVSRPKSRNTWGVPVPGDDTQIMYVWFDALVNYLTSAGFPWKDNAGFQGSIWPADIQIVGKDIVRFHGLYWPAFLLAAGIPPPKQLVVHSHWIKDGKKMSKSIGNVVDASYTLDMFGPDSVKFFLMNDSYLDHDSVFDNSRVLARHNTELVNKYGNLVMRVCGKAFSIEQGLAMSGAEVEKAFDTMDLPSMRERHELLVSDTNTLVSRMARRMNAEGGAGTAHALGEVWLLISYANQFLQDCAPWTFAKHSSEQNAIIRDAAEVARVCSIALQPFIPEISARMLDRLSVDPSKRSVEFAQYGADTTYGKNANRKGDYPVQVIESDDRV